MTGFCSARRSTINKELKVTKLATFESKIVRFDTTFDDILKPLPQDGRLSQFIDEAPKCKEIAI